MKKILSILLVCVLLTGCGKKSITLNSPIEHEDWEFKLVNVEFSDIIGNTMSEFYLTSSYHKGDDRFYVKAESDKTFLLFELQMEYKGNKKLSINFEEELELNYNDGYIVEPFDVNVNIGGKWDKLDNWVYVAGTRFDDTEKLEVDPLDETTYILRGVFEVSEKVETEIENSLVLKLPFDLEYTVR